MGEGTGDVFVGRAGDLAKLTSALDEAERSKGSFHLVAGEAGLGKTSLSRKAMEEAKARGWAVLSGECFLGEENVPYFPVTRAVRGYLAKANQTSSDVPQMAMGLMALDQGGNRTSSPVEFTLERDKLFQGVLEFLHATARDTPMLFFIDDLQWADRATLQLLLYLTHAMKGTRSLFLGAYRPEEVRSSGGSHPFTELESRLVYEGLVRKVELKPLGPEDTARVASSVVGHEISETLVKRIHSLSAGNPFFIKEFSRAFRQQELDTGKMADGRSDTIDGIPSTVAEVIAARSRRLDADARAILELCSVLGQEFGYDILLAASGQPEDRVVETLENLFAAGMLEESEVGGNVMYHFTHSLMREVTYNHLSRARRRLLHRKVGEYLEDKYAGNTEQAAFSLAYHFLRTSESTKALDYHILAGRVAMHEQALEDARGFFETALDIILKSEGAGEAQWKEVEVLTTLGRTIALLGDWKKALDHYGQALALSKDDTPERALVHRYIAEVEMLRFELGAAVEHLNKSIAISEKRGDTRGLAEAYRCLAWICEEQGKIDEAIGHAERVIAEAQKLGDTYLAGKALIDIGNSLVTRDQTDRAIEYYKQALEKLDRKKNVDQVARAYNNIGNALMKKGQHRKALEYFRAVLEIPQAKVIPMARAYVLSNMCEGNYRLGQLDEAQKYLKEALALQSLLGNRAEQTNLLVMQGLMAFDVKDIPATEASFAKALDMSHDAGLPTVSRLHRDYGIVKKKMGDKQAAKEHLEKALAMYIEMGGASNAEKVWSELKDL